MSTAIGIKAYSTKELLEELCRRENKKTALLPDKWCDNCAHFLPKDDSSESFNPCSKSHKMQFWMPEDYDFKDYGFYRRVCPDREDKNE